MMCTHVKNYDEKNNTNNVNTFMICAYTLFNKSFKSTNQKLISCTLYWFKEKTVTQFR